MSGDNGEDKDKVLMKEAVMIAISPEGKLAIRTSMNNKAETIGILLSAVSIVAMQPDKPKSSIIKPTAGQIIGAGH